MGLFDSILGMAASSGLENQAIAAIAGKLGIAPAMAQNVAGSLLSNMQGGQSPQDAVAAAAQEHGVDPSAVGQLGEALAGHAGAEGGLGGLASMLGGAAGGEGGAAGLAGMLGGLMGGAKS